LLGFVGVYLGDDFLEKKGAEKLGWIKTAPTFALPIGKGLGERGVRLVISDWV
jgi:hypothetical protein